MSDYNFQVQEEDAAEGTLNYLKKMNPDILQTQGTQKFKTATADAISMQRQLAQQMLTNSDEEMLVKDEQINEEIYSNYEDESQSQQAKQVVLVASTAFKNRQEEVMSKKEREIKEIEALIRKAQASTNNAIEAASRKKEQSKANTPAQLRTPNAVLEVASSSASR